MPSILLAALIAWGILMLAVVIVSISNAVVKIKTWNAKDRIFDPLKEEKNERENDSEGN